MKLTEENYVEIAEQVIKKLHEEKNQKGQPIGIVTTSKIRNLLSMTANIYNDVVNTKAARRNRAKANNMNRNFAIFLAALGILIVFCSINYLKLRFVYEAGREQKVKRLVETAQILQCLDAIKGNRSQYILFSRYMEALVAYRKFYEKDE